MRKIIIAALTVLFLNAGVYTQKLSQCLITHTNKQDRILLAKWMFVVLSQYPELKSLSKVTPDTIETYNKKIASLFERLLIKECKNEASAVLKHEPDGMRKSFNVLGNIAAKEIMLNPNVLQTVTGYTKYLDLNKLVKELRK